MTLDDESRPLLQGKHGGAKAEGYGSPGESETQETSPQFFLAVLDFLSCGCVRRLASGESNNGGSGLPRGCDSVDSFEATVPHSLVHAHAELRRLVATLGAFEGGKGEHLAQLEALWDALFSKDSALAQSLPLPRKGGTFARSALEWQDFGFQ